MSVNSTDPMIGRLLDGRYQIRSRIARGGMATVYLATDLRLERRVAIKVMHGHLADDSKFKERFIQEARSAARLAHPNVVNVFDQGQDSDMAYLVMEYLPGITLRDLLIEHRVLTTEQTLDIMEAVLAGLAAAHKSGIVHRDLKPENVLLADDGRIKIGDFGLARAASAQTATGAALLGTIAYLSPELVTRGVADSRSDIYAVGIMMFEMLTGEQPFKGEQPMQIAYQHANDAVPPPSRKNSRVPPELDDLVVWATERDPEDRPRDARAMLDQLYETHSALMTSLPSTSSTSVQRTMVMPTATGQHPSATAETQVIGSLRSRPPAAVAIPDNAATLAARTNRRRGRRWIVATAIVALVALAATLGWYFGVGPGSQVAIPDNLAGMTIVDATAALDKVGLAVNPVNGETDSPTIAVGLVAATDPPAGFHVVKGGTVQLLISTGPKPLPVPIFAGMTEEQAKSAITAAPFTLTDPIIRQFDPDIAAGTVLDALATADGTSLTGVATYGEGQPITLVVSAGPLPVVTNLSVADATAALQAAGLLLGAVNEAEYNDSVVQGNAIRLQSGDGSAPVRVGDTVDIITSKGVEYVQIPADIEGKIVKDAIAELESLGFRVSDSGFTEAQKNVYKVQKTDPQFGTSVPKGSTISITQISLF
ncbi:MAG: Stk1 family PASTA domain-containing Ser/Thr kinase [Salinibacterium sp.]|nr:Stk1 family PASTA domain-containing Ser/Thr kinase [Salinibacterium sp.]